MDRYMTIGIQKKDALQVNTVQEMRKAIFRSRRNCTIVASCLANQECDGLSGEETMTMIAFDALVQLQRMYENTVDLINKTPYPSNTGEL